jgi:hypothetical protein
VEQGFKVAKTAGWQWQRSRMADPRRAARLWAALALATLWLLEVGGAAEAAVPPETLPRLPGARPRRRHRVFRRGLALVLAALVLGRPLPRGRFVPEPWPRPAYRGPPGTEDEFAHRYTYPS